jgi:hypothetical protein
MGGRARFRGEVTRGDAQEGDVDEVVSTTSGRTRSRGLLQGSPRGWAFVTSLPLESVPQVGARA